MKVRYSIVFEKETNIFESEKEIDTRMDKILEDIIKNPHEYTDAKVHYVERDIEVEDYEDEY